MPRHHHLLKAGKSAGYPNQVVILDCDVDRSNVTGSDSIQTARLVGWVGCGFSGQAGEYGADHWESGAHAASWWWSVAHRLRKKGNLWVVAQNACQVMSLLGLWELIEDRYWQVCGGDHRDVQERGTAHVQSVPDDGGNTAGARGDANVHELPDMPGCGRAEDTRGSVRPRQNSKVPRGVCCLEDPPTVLDVRPQGLPGRMRLLDARNYGVSALPETMPARERVAHWSAFFRAMVSTLRANNMGGLQCTVASQSMSSFRVGYYTHPIECHNNLEVLGLEEASYVGGRCEAHRLGVLPGRIWHLDVSSMYPSVYTRERVPVSLASIGRGERLLFAALRDKVPGCIAEVGIETNEPCYPLHDRKLGITVWPVGRFSTTLCGPELEDAHDRGRIVHVSRVAVYSTCAALSAWGSCVARLRAGMPPAGMLRGWAKSLGVCIVGKLGQKDRKWVSADWQNYCEPWQQWHVCESGAEPQKWRSVCWHTQREEIGGFSFDAVPAMASYITSYARMRLLAMIRCAHWRDVYYCDTDSLMVSESGRRRLIEGGWVRPGESGFLREVEVGERVVVYGIKDYDFAGRLVRAGQSADVDCYTSDGPRIWVGQRAAGACKSGSAPTAARTSVLFERRARYQHGTRMPDGTVQPLVYNEL